MSGYAAGENSNYWAKITNGSHVQTDAVDFTIRYDTIEEFNVDYSLI